MAKPSKTSEADKKRNKETAHVGKRVRFKIGKAQKEFVGEIKGHEGAFALVMIDGQDAATRVYASLCFPE